MASDVLVNIFGRWRYMHTTILESFDKRQIAAEEYSQLCRSGRTNEETPS